MKKINLQEICEIAMFSALAIVLDRFVKIPISIGGGSINISIFPLLFIAIRHGFYKGFLASGICYGIITCFLDNYGIQYLLFDYILGFGSAAIVGLFSKYINDNFSKEKKQTLLCYVFVLISIISWMILRIVFCSIDAVLFMEYEFIPACLVNFSYCFISAVADFIIIALLLPLIVTINKKFQIK